MITAILVFNIIGFGILLAGGGVAAMERKETLTPIDFIMVGGLTCAVLVNVFGILVANEILVMGVSV